MTLPITPSFRLDGRRALVTGAGRGIGLALAAALAEAGAQVTLVARSANEIEAGASAIRERGEAADAAPLDIADRAAVAAFFRSRPAFQVLVNNAGTNRPKPMQDVTEPIRERPSRRLAEATAHRAYQSRAACAGRSVIIGDRSVGGRIGS